MASSATCPWHSLAPADVARALATDMALGLTAAEAAARLARIGTNELARSPPEPWWSRLGRQFTELVIWILIVAAGLSAALGDWADAAAIAAIILVNALIGFFQEERASQAIAALERLSAPTAKVTRDGRLMAVPARDLVPGDRIEIEAGDAISADARLIAAHSLRTQEAALTGESTTVEKRATAVVDAAAPLGDRRTMIHAGTVVAAGRGEAVVVATGMETELGHIAGLLERAPLESTPLQRRLAELGRVLIVICLSIVAILAMLDLRRGGNVWDVMLSAVSLAVAAVPEGLPAVVTLVLAIGVQRLVSRNALVRRLPSVETLGSVTVICSDKTGTLTRNEMTVREIHAGPCRYRVTGSGYAPRGDFRVGQDGEQPVDPHGDADLRQLLTIAAVCNNAAVQPSDDGVGWQVVGDPTEGALIVAALKAGIEQDRPDERIILEIPFDSERKRMSVVVRHADGRQRLFAKGAPEAILPQCTAEQVDGAIVPLTAARREAILAAADDMARRALRVLGLAWRPHGMHPHDDGDSDLQEHELVFSGLAGMLDPPRDEARAAVERCRTAGIHPVMITGDHPATALAIARELGLAGEGDRAVSGVDLVSLSATDLARGIGSLPVFARVSAADKLRVVKAWQARGDVVAMTGDGVNDAPAVRSADIGIAMGITGTDVTKEASDMVLTDDNFTSIVNAVEEGRSIYENIQKFMHYLLACNAGEVLLMAAAALAGWPPPLAPIQILWLNLVTDGLPALALGLEPPEPDIMHRPPRPPQEPVITWTRGLTILGHGLLVGGVCLAAFWLSYRGDPARMAQARTFTFCVAAFAQLFFAVACRSDTLTAGRLGWLSNPWLLAAIAISGLVQAAIVMLPFAQPVFAVEGDLGREWTLVLVLALIPVSVVEIVKEVTACRHSSGSPATGSGT